MSAVAVNPYRTAVHAIARPAPAMGGGKTAANNGQPPNAPGLKGADRHLAVARAKAAGLTGNRPPRTGAEEALLGADGGYNPLAHGNDELNQNIRRAIRDPRSRVFNDRGVLNAWDNKDALTQIASLLSRAQRDGAMARLQRQADVDVDPIERRDILASAMQSESGFRALGQQLLLPVKDIVDYEGWCRKIFRVRPLKQAEPFRAAKDVRSTAWVIGQDGQGVETVLHGRYIAPPEFKIGSFPVVDIADIYQMNYDVLERAQDTARQEIELEEDKRGIAVLDAASTAVNSVVSYGTLGVGAFEDVRLQVENHRLNVETFVIARSELSDIIKTMSTQVDPVTERELILAGYIGSIMNAMIVTTAGTGVEQVVPSGTFYALTAPEYLGEMGIRIELFSEPFNMYAQQRFVKGWAFGEMIGFVVMNPRAVAKGVKI